MNREEATNLIAANTVAIKLMELVDLKQEAKYYLPSISEEIEQSLTILETALEKARLENQERFHKEFPE